MIINKSYGVLFQYNRKKQNVTLKRIANAIGCSVSRINKFERGVQYFSEKEIIKLYQVIGLEFQIDTFYEHKIEEWTKLLFSNIVKGKKTKNMKEFLLEVENKFIYNEYYFVVLLLKLIYGYFYNELDKESCIKLKEEIEEYVEYLPSDYSCIAYDCFGLIEEDCGNYKKALVCYEKASNNNLNDLSNAMINYHKGRAYSYFGKYNEALKYNERAKQVFQKYYCIYRILICGIQEGICIMNLRNYTKAIEIFQHIYDLVEEIDYYKELKGCILHNLIYTYFCMKKNEKLLDYQEEALKYVENKFEYYLIYSIVYKRYNDNQKALEYINQAKVMINKSKKQLVYYLYAYDALITNHNVSQFEQYMNQAITCSKDENDIQFLNYLYLDLIDNFRNLGLIEKESYYSRIYLLQYQNEGLVI